MIDLLYTTYLFFLCATIILSRWKSSKSMKNRSETNHVVAICIIRARTSIICRAWSFIYRRFNIGLQEVICHAIATQKYVRVLWFMVTAVYGPFGRCSSYEKVQKARTGSDRLEPMFEPGCSRRPAPDPPSLRSPIYNTVVSDVGSCASRY